MRTTSAFRLILVIVSAIIFCGGCATLPNVTEVINETAADQESPQILAAKGFLSPAQSDAVIERLKHAVENAKDHINIETFIFEGDEMGSKFADLLLKKQSEGVQVNIIYDSVGSLGTPGSFFDRLKYGGIHVIEFNPVNPAKLFWKRLLRWQPIYRDHRKIFIVDGKVAITGGVNISGVYSGGLSGRQEKDEKKIPWRDTGVRQALPDRRKQPVVVMG
ncbi:MAG: phospholipase D-like domain-containing protein [Nitrospiraceae bacterium]|nr:phospholipase D-like domain-containing protein [Nitrospiraceae bacterium]